MLPTKLTTLKNLVYIASESHYTTSNWLNRSMEPGSVGWSLHRWVAALWNPVFWGWPLHRWVVAVWNKEVWGGRCIGWAVAVQKNPVLVGGCCIWWVVAVWKNPVFWGWSLHRWAVALRKNPIFRWGLQAKSSSHKSFPWPITLCNNCALFGIWKEQEGWTLWNNRWTSLIYTPEAQWTRLELV